LFGEIAFAVNPVGFFVSLPIYIIGFCGFLGSGIHTNLPLAEYVGSYSLFSLAFHIHFAMTHDH
jgi:hypothetical protein